MIFLSGLIGFLLVLTAESRVGNSSKLSFCFETEECLLFDLICKTSEYEVRHYDSVKWVTTEESSFFMEIAAMRAFRRLFNYIDGGNANGEKIEMTAPVIMKMGGPKRFWQMQDYSMSFLLPSKHQMNPPNPVDDKVQITAMPAKNMYVRSYGGWMTGLTEINQASSLADALNAVDAKFKRGSHYAVGYNSPMTIFNRHNEVWYEVEDEPECNSSEEVDMSLFS